MTKMAGTSNWTRAETDCLLLIIKGKLFLSPDDWEEVKACFDTRYADKQCTVTALQQKFTSLQDRTKEPTGNPSILPAVLTMKRIRDMIDEKTEEGTRGSPDSFKVRESDDKEDDEEHHSVNNFDLGNNNEFCHNSALDNDLSITPLTYNPVQEIAYLGGSAEKSFFTPIVQVVHLKKSASECYDVHLSDGISFMLGTCAELVSALADEKYFTLFLFIKVEGGRVCYYYSSKWYQVMPAASCGESND